MCGIVGAVNKVSQNRESFEQQLIAMRDTMIHRGPDGCGVWTSNDGKIGFGHRRLSIIDLSEAGKQPMSNPEETIWITFNGEIYNHLEIRKELERRGYKYHSWTDTETIIYAYQEWGIDCLNKFNGMFAIGLYDLRNDTLYLVRDRVGIKSLYYTDTGKNFLFASEIKAFFKHENVNKKFSANGAYHYLTFGSTPSPFTLFENIYKLPAGHYLKLTCGLEPEVVEWWNPLWNTSSQPTFENEVGYSEYLLDLLRDSVRLRTMSDVPYGAFLSGGVDSSLITALMTEQTGKSIDTYSIDVEGDNPYSEQYYANIVAKKFNSNHYVRTISDHNFEDFFLKNYSILDEPLTTQDFVALNHLSKLTHDNGTIVVQVGEGSDELFMGYEGLDYLAGDFYSKFLRFSKFPLFMKKPFSSLVYAIASNKPDNIYNAAYNREYYWAMNIVFGEQAKKSIFLKRISKDLDTYRIIKNHYKSIYDIKPNANISQKMLYMALKNRLPEHLLLRVDRIGMANSIEPRVPFLDYRLVEFAFNVPYNVKINNGVHKYLLKKVAETMLPVQVVYRKKIGFCGSTDQMLSPKLRSFALRITSEEIEKMDNIFDVREIRNLLDNQKRQSNSNEIWTLLNLSLWFRMWFE